MSVFKEKNGFFEGANRMCDPAGVRCAPAGFAAVKKTRLENTLRLNSCQKIFFIFRKLMRFIAPCKLLRKGGGSKKNY